MRILVVEDEREIAELTRLYLQSEGFDAVLCHDGLEALDIVARERFDAAILDIMLPGADGFSICAKIREQYTYPVIMLTAKVEELDKLTGLGLGADDYMTKPFSPLELIARVKAQIRRATRYSDAGAGGRADTYDAGGLVIDRAQHTCFLYDQPIDLTPIEFDLLWTLCENAGRVVSAEVLFEKVWGEKFMESANTVMVHIRRLREKLHEPPRNPKFIKTVWGVGYKIEKK